ncbi:MAG: hypothetical protein IAE79_25410 [Anaerolinea sp.]|nr:hypothetical protein [Anaerolinea sp.]
MNLDNGFRRLAGWTAVFSAPLAYGTLIISFVGIGGDMGSFDTAVNQNAATILPLLAQKPHLPLWSSLFDFFGFYLLLLPLAIYLWYWLHPQRGAWATLFTVCGLGYLLFGALGAAVLAVLFPAQAVLYGQTSGVEQQIALAMFTAVGDAVQRAVWGILDPILAGVWWAGMGWLLRDKRAWLGWGTLGLGLVNLLSGLSAAFQFDSLANVALVIYFILAPLWAGWMGVDLLRQRQSLT